MKLQLVGGFNQFEKYESKWESSPSRDAKETYIWNHHLEYVCQTCCFFGMSSCTFIYKYLQQMLLRNLTMNRIILKHMFFLGGQAWRNAASSKNKYQLS